MSSSVTAGTSAEKDSIQEPRTFQFTKSQKGNKVKPHTLYFIQEGSIAGR